MEHFYIGIFLKRYSACNNYKLFKERLLVIFTCYMEANRVNLALLSVSLRPLLLPHCFDTSPELFPELWEDQYSLPSWFLHLFNLKKCLFACLLFLKHVWFTMFQMYSKVTHTHAYAYIHIDILFQSLSHRRLLQEVCFS